MVPQPWTAYLDRCADERLREGLIADLLADPATRVVDWSSDGALIDTSLDGAARSTRLALRPGSAYPHPGLAFFLGRDDTGSAWVAVVTDEPREPGEPGDVAGASGAPDAAEPVRLGLRDIGHRLPGVELEAYLTTQALAGWHRNHPCCPRCGAPTVATHAGWVRRCEADGSEHYPRCDPAVIMAVTDPDDRLLLARAPAWPQNRRSVLAGFVEPGERLEMAVAREVAEEVGLAVDDVEYVGSQPWPFPASLMLGFTARAGTSDLRIDDGEIAAAEWYTREQLRAVVADGTLGLPGRLSIARRLIEGWFGEPLTPQREVPFHRPDASHLDGPPSSGR